jgi:hypothetical protein
MMTRQLRTAVAMALGLASGAAVSADLGNLNGQTCGDATGTWHFVNNQTGGAGAGTLTAQWSSGNSCVTNASTVNKSNQHFYCTASGTLVSAFTNLPGRLVLSDWSCTDVKEPPVCDPKKQICDDPK